MVLQTQTFLMRARTSLPVCRRTYGVHESAVHVGVEQVGHGEDGAVAEGRQAARHAPLPADHLLPVVLHLAAVVQQVHEQGEVPDGRENQGGGTVTASNPLETHYYSSSRDTRFSTASSAYQNLVRECKSAQ